MKEFMRALVSNAKADVVTNAGWYYFLLFMFVLVVIDLVFWFFI